MNNSKKAKADWSDKSILIVDDLKTIFDYFKLAMSRTGAKLFWADNGEKAVDYVKKEHGIKLVLMDINMPGMDGYEAGKKIKEIKPDVPVIIQTAYVLDESEQKALKMGMDGYISKPIRLNALMELLEGFLGRA